jgi:hypothetical protein
MHATIVSRTPSSFTVEVPAGGNHMGRNGLVKIEKLEVMVFFNGTFSLNSINSKGRVTNGGMFEVPVGALLDLLTALKGELEKTQESDEPDGNPAGSD